MRTLRTLAACAALTALAGPALAVEPPRVQASLAREGEALRLELEVSHAGGLPLHDVFPRIHLGRETLELESQPEITIGATTRWTHPLEQGEIFPEGGPAPPLLIRVHYHDGTGYPFSVATVVPVEPEAPFPLDAEFELLGPPAQTRAELTLRNPGTRAQEGTAIFFSAIELAARPARVPFRVDAGAELRIVSALRAEGALGGSYPVFAVVQTAAPDAGSLVLSEPLQVTRAMLERPPLRRRAALLGILVATLFLVTALFELRSAAIAPQD